MTPTGTVLPIEVVAAADRLARALRETPEAAPTPMHFILRRTPGTMGSLAPAPDPPTAARREFAIQHVAALLEISGPVFGDWLTAGYLPHPSRLGALTHVSMPSGVGGYIGGIWDRRRLEQWAADVLEQGASKAARP